MIKDAFDITDYAVMAAIEETCKAVGTGVVYGFAIVTFAIFLTYGIFKALGLLNMKSN